MPRGRTFKRGTLYLCDKKGNVVPAWINDDEKKATPEPLFFRMVGGRPTVYKGSLSALKALCAGYGVPFQPMPPLNGPRKPTEEELHLLQKKHEDDPKRFMSRDERLKLWKDAHEEWEKETDDHKAMMDAVPNAYDWRRSPVAPMCADCLARRLAETKKILGVEKFPATWSHDQVNAAYAAKAKELLELQNTVFQPKDAKEPVSIWLLSKEGWEEFIAAETKAKVDVDGLLDVIDAL
jgi:hypothetical protein